MATTDTRTGTREWSDESFNLHYSDGKCPHKCSYCYAGEHFRRFGYVPKQKPIKKYKGVIMFPTRHDIVPENLAKAEDAICGLLNAGNRLLIVTKPHIQCVESICSSLFYHVHKDQVLWRFTIGSASDDVLRYWEPGAPAFEERLRCLCRAYELGFKTSVSMEPMLDGKPDDVICRVSPYVTDAIWLGRANRLIQRMSTNGWKGQEDMRRAAELVKTWDDKAVLDLYARLRHHAKIRWKDSIRFVIGNANG